MSTTRGPLRVKRAVIEDFRGIDHLEIEFPEGDAPDEGGVLVLGGDNGSGKTTVLEALALGLGQKEKLPVNSVQIESQVRFGHTDFSIELTIHRGQKDHVLQCDKGILALQPIFETGWDGGGAWGPNGPFWETIELWQPRVVYVSARRDPEGSHQPPSAEDSNVSSKEAERIAALKRTVINIFHRMSDPKVRARSERAQRFERLQRFIRRFLGETVTVDVMYVDDNDRHGQDVVVRYGDLPEGVVTLADAKARAESQGDVPLVLPIEQLSAGQLSLFAFAEPLIFSEQPPDLVLIDEPERHMHVQWQRALLPALRELTPTTQFVVATHSAEIMESVASYEVLYLLPKGDPRRRPAEDGADARSP